MPAARSSMRKIKDVLRLKYEADLSCRQIAASLKLSVGVISKYTQAAEAAGLSWPLPDGLDDTTLAARLFPPVTTVREHVMPDCAYVHQELKRKGVTLMLLWEEYRVHLRRSHVEPAAAGLGQLACPGIQLLRLRTGDRGARQPQISRDAPLLLRAGAQRHPFIMTTATTPAAVSTIRASLRRAALTIDTY